MALAARFLAPLVALLATAGCAAGYAVIRQDGL